MKLDANGFVTFAKPVREGGVRQCAKPTVFRAVPGDHHDVINPTTHCVSAELYDELVVPGWERSLRVVPQVVIDTAQAPDHFR